MRTCGLPSFFYGSTVSVLEKEILGVRPFSSPLDIESRESERDEERFLIEPVQRVTVTRSKKSRYFIPIVGPTSKGHS